jgi:hypothetical protein
MHEKFRKRLEILEETAALANAPAQIININFVNGDGSEVAPTVARHCRGRRAGVKAIIMQICITAGEVLRIGCSLSSDDLGQMVGRQRSGRTGEMEP